MPRAEKLGILRIGCQGVEMQFRVAARRVLM